MFAIAIDLAGKEHDTKLSNACVLRGLKDGINLQQAIQTAKEIDQQSKQAGFNQNALDQLAKFGFSNAQFEVNAEEGLDLVEEFYTNESTVELHQKPDDLSRIQDIQKGLNQSVQALN